MTSTRECVIFDDGDGRYRNWMQTNSTGFVLNTGRGQNSSYVMFHRSLCHHITTHENSFPSDAFTKHDFIKVCSTSLHPLETWQKENRPKATLPLRYCKTCDPTNGRGKTNKKTEATGYWTFFCNPAKWEIDKFLATATDDDTYQITNWQRDFFQPGQLGVIRVGIDRRNKKQLAGRPKLESGIYAIVEVQSSPIKREMGPDKFWLDWTEEEKQKPVVKIHFLKNLLTDPILLSTLKNDSEIDDSYLLQGFQAATMPLTQQSFQRILERAGNVEQVLENIKEGVTPSSLSKIEQLEEKYANAVPEVKEVISKRIERGAIAEQVKKLTGRKCQICEALGQNPYSFEKKNGQHYVETHHVIPVSETRSGTLGLANLITVCANHHRQVHYGKVEVDLTNEDAFVFTINGHKIVIKRNKIM